MTRDGISIHWHNFILNFVHEAFKPQMGFKFSILYLQKFVGAFFVFLANFILFDVNNAFYEIFKSVFTIYSYYD